MRPRTVLIDSEQLESGRALDKNFRAAASDEIERFRSEIVKRTGDRRQAENLSDQDLLLPRQGRWDAFRHRPGACAFPRGGGSEERTARTGRSR